MSPIELANTAGVICVLISSLMMASCIMTLPLQEILIDLKPLEISSMSFLASSQKFFKSNSSRPVKVVIS